MNKKSIVTVIATLIAGIVIGIGLMQIDGFHSSVQTALGNEETQNNLTGSTQNAENVQLMEVMNSAELEQALLVVQSNRTNLLEGQLADQITKVQQRNEEVVKWNELLGQLKEVRALSSNTDASELIPAGKLDDKIADIKNKLTTYQLVSDFKTFGDVDKLMTDVKAQIDTLGNSQQMDMLRLQNLSNERNEAFEVMSNFIKKMQESRSAILGNMR